MRTYAINDCKTKARRGLPYPNAATRQEMLNKFIDLLLVGAIGAGLAASMLLLLVLV